MLKILKITIVFSLLFPFCTQAQIEVDTTLTPTELVETVLLGNGVSVSNITFNGQAGTILNSQIARMSGESDFVDFPESVVMKSGHTYQVEDGAWFPPFFPYPDPDITDDPDLQQISGINSINNAAILEFDFIPNGDSLIFRYVFASTEYPGFTCSSFNDAFGFFLSGPGINGPFTNDAINIALIPDTDIPVAVNTVNSGAASNPGNEGNCEDANPNWIEDSQYFVDNSEQPEGDIQFPGMTQTFTAYAEVECGVEYHIKLAIGDASDGALDSGVFLEAGSFTSNSVVNVNLEIPVGVGDSTLYEGCGEALLEFIRPSESSGLEETVYLDIAGSGVNGIDFVPELPDSIIFEAGQDTVSFSLTAPADGAIEGEEFVNITITNIASNCSGAVLTSNFQFYINEDDPLVVESFDGELADCNDEITLFPTISGGYGEYNYAWSNGATQDTITVSPGFSTTYFLVVSDTCNLEDVQASFDVEVPLYPPITVDLGEDFIVEECDVTETLDALVEGGFGSYSYNWIENGENIGNTPVIDFEVQNTTEVELIVTDECGATGTDEVMITVPPIDVIAYLPNVFQAESCLDDIIMPAISEGGIGEKTYTWIVDGEEQVTTAAPFFMYNPAMGQNVIVMAEDECENIGIDSTVVDFNFPPVEIEVSKDTSICEGTDAVLMVDILSGSGGYDINWEGSDSTNTYTVSPGGSRNYTVIVEDTCGIKAEGRTRVIVREVIADFDYEYIDYYGLDLINFSRAVNPTYLWDFGDGNTSEERDTQHLFQDIDPYDVVLTVTDDIGCRDSVKLTTIPPSELFIPNAITPNGDGINDLFGVKGENIRSFEMRIFDRWGNQVFHTSDINQKWNGTDSNGEYFSTTTTYTFLIRYKGEKKDDAIERTGHVTVIR
ncbi:MAG TPA: choice-of-anchor L domain-containing protein [Cryomorphaceae bacterium]|nr:choice-of-anchor L domain-containing protein [Cryomorphaceae bacterium]